MNKRKLSNAALALIISAACAIVLLVTDLVTKISIVNYFKTHTEPIVLIPDFLRINYTLNEAAAFGIGLSNATVNRVIYCIVACLGVIAIGLILGFKWKKMHPAEIACCFAIGTGALGNLVDRCFYTADFLSGSYLTTDKGGLVVDWIDFYGIWQFIFNVADICVVLGVIALVIYLIVDEVKVAKAKKAEEPKLEKGEKVLSKQEQDRLEEEQKEVEQPVTIEENKKEE